MAERIRKSIDKFTFKLPDGRTLKRTASLGVAGLAPGETHDELMERADQALYRAKEGGRNQTVISRAPGATVKANRPQIVRPK